MSGRPKGRIIKASRRTNGENKFDKPELLTLLDVQCTVCMGIFIEPVTLPCFHTVCKLCFEKTIDNNTLACPLCRKYVGGWVRQRQKNGLMVNQTLWTYISKHFQSHVQKKQKGEDDEDIDGLTELTIRAPIISEPGLIRREYEAERQRIQDESRKLQEQEAEASEKLIKELQEREEKERKHLEELRRKAEEEDALIAQRIAAQLDAEEAQKQVEDEESVRRLLQEEQASSAFVKLESHQTSSHNSQPLKKGPMDMFLNQINTGKLTRTGSSSSTDSLNSELHYFRPVHFVPTTPPKNPPDGAESDTGQMRKPVPVMRSLDGWISAGSNTLRPWVQNNPSGLQSDKLDAALPDLNSTKRRRSPPNVLGRSPKKSRKELQLQNSTLHVPQSKKQVNVETRQKHPVNETVTKVTDSLLETELNIRKSEQHNIFGSTSSFQSACKRQALKAKSITGLGDIENALLPLSLQEFSEEQRSRQEQEDYEFALKLQSELNANESQNRSYELRSIVSLSPKKKQSKVTTPRGKTKPKPPTSSLKKEKRRQCTLEESMSFSVKMEL